VSRRSPKPWWGFPGQPASPFPEARPLPISNRRRNIRAILANPAQRRELLTQTIVATQAREGIETTLPQAEAAYDAVQAEIARSYPPSLTAQAAMAGRQSANRRPLGDVPPEGYDSAQRLAWLVARLRHLARRYSRYNPLLAYFTGYANRTTRRKAST